MCLLLVAATCLPPVQTAFMHFPKLSVLLMREQGRYKYRVCTKIHVELLCHRGCSFLAGPSSSRCDFQGLRHWQSSDHDSPTVALTPGSAALRAGWFA